MKSRFMCYIIILTSIISTFSCGQKFDYTITYANKYEHGGGQYGLSAGINIPSKIPKEDLLKLGLQLRQRWSDILLMDVRISVPSEYPDDPEGWWCTYHYQKFGAKSTDIEEYIHYMGPPSQLVEDSLKNIQPQEGKLLGKWYLKISCSEKSMFLIQKDSLYFLEIHPYVDKGRGEATKHEVITLLSLNNDNSKFKDKERPSDVYTIQKDGNMRLEFVLSYKGGAIARKY